MRTLPQPSALVPRAAQGPTGHSNGSQGSLWVSGSALGQGTAESRGSCFLWRLSQEPRDAPNPILQSLSLFLSLYPSLSLLPCSPTSVDTQERQHHQHTSQVAPSNSPHIRGGTPPSPSPSHAHQAGSSGLWAVSLFPAFPHPAPSQADLAGHCVKVQPGLSSHEFLQLLSPKSHHQEGGLDDLQEGCSQRCFVVRNCRRKGDSRERE